MPSNNSGSGKLTFFAPLLSGGNYHYAQVLGNSVWLWMHSSKHSDAPLALLGSQMLPALDKRQFALGFDESGAPSFYLAWAWFDAETEAEYIKHGNRMLTPFNWCTGDRLWLIYFFAPFGHVRESWSWLEDTLFPTQFAYFLYHRGKERGLRVILRKGTQTTAAEAIKWHEEHPILVNVPVTLPRGKLP